MTHQEINDFFKQHGATVDIKIVDSPVFEYFVIKNNNVYSASARVNSEWITSIDDFIKDRVNLEDQTVYIYSQQEFTNRMDLIRSYTVKKDIMEVRRFKLNKLMDKMKHYLS